VTDSFEENTAPMQGPTRNPSENAMPTYAFFMDEIVDIIEKK
jgi:hypothetical protein